MSNPVLLGDVIATLFADARAHDVDAAFAKEWTDVEKILLRPSSIGCQLEIAIGRGLVDITKYHNRIYAKKSDIKAVFGDEDYFVKLRFRHA